MDPRDLPIHKHRERILDAIGSHQVIVVESPTGSGKTTQLPLILYEAGVDTTGVIGVTQPRRIAAVSVSEYIARQIGSDIPGIVGYKMRFDDKTVPETRIKVMTDGILLQELKADPLLSSYGTIMVDEAHERSLNIDFVLGLLKRILRDRSDFRVIVSSATINADVFSEYFDECPVVRIDAEPFPVDTRYLPLSEKPSDEELLSRIGSIIDEIASSDAAGDVLIFLTGEQQIKTCIAQIQGSRSGRRLQVLPLYGRLAKEEQDQVFLPPPGGTRKIVVATNIAETSITIDGIRWVIDSGLAKINYYNPKTFTASLVETPISRASCNQRKGRAGRTAPGVCYRLYSRKSYQARPLYTTEEIYRTDLSEVVLRMSELGIYDFETFDFLSPPDLKDVRGAIETLTYLDAINDDRSLSTVGAMMARFPMLPRQSRIIVEAIMKYPQVIGESIVAASFLSANSPFLLPQGEEIEARNRHHRFRSDQGDFVSYLRLLSAYRSASHRESFCKSHYLDPRVMAEIDNIAYQLSEIVSEMGIPLESGGSTKDYLCAVAKGLIQFVCTRDGNRMYRSSTAERIYIHPGSVMFRTNPPYIVAGEIVQTSRTFARSVSPLEPSWLPDISPRLAGVSRRTAAPARNRKPDRDTTWHIQIGPEIFELRPFKGRKKIAVLPWERFAPLLRSGLIPGWVPGKDLRAVIEYRGYEVCYGYRLRKTMRILELVDLDRDFLSDGIETTDMSYPEDAEALRNALSRIGRIAPIGKGKKTGFVTLHTDGEKFRQKVHRAVGHAAAESLSAVEQIADMELDEKTHEAANQAYRRLLDLLDR